MAAAGAAVAVAEEEEEEEEEVRCVEIWTAPKRRWRFSSSIARITSRRSSRLCGQTRRVSPRCS